MMDIFKHTKFVAALSFRRSPPSETEKLNGLLASALEILVFGAQLDSL